ncbi:MAG TPA: response regulator [Chryseosolibacter sp.]
MKLLIIDDDRVCTFITTWVAKDSGIFKEIQSFQNGREALNFFDQVAGGTASAPDLILMDLNMPMISGFDLIGRLNELTFPDVKRPRIAILTSSDNRADVERARSLGVEDYLLKSANLKDLQSSLYLLCRDACQKPGKFKDNIAINRAGQISNRPTA